jgi:hypothetical protein
MAVAIVHRTSTPAAERVVAFAGDVKLPGSAEVHGGWSVFIADPLTGRVITAACCGEGDSPPGIDQLPDLACN